MSVENDHHTTKFDFLDAHYFAGSLSGKTALITGAGRGIGKAIAIAFAHAGCNVACVSRTESEVEAVAAFINSTSSFEARAFVCDVGDVDSIPELICKIRIWMDRPIYILVNNAGVARIEVVEYQHDMTAWNQILATNLTGPVALSYQVLPDMLSGGGGGVIISVGSRNSIYSIPYMTAYSVSKTGLLRFHENLEREIRGRGVRNYYVVPGNVDTSILAGKDSIDDEGFRNSQGARHMVDLISDADKVPSEIVANTCVMLAADKSLEVLSGRYIDTEGDLGAILEDVRSGNESKCSNQGLYRLKMDTL